MPPGVDVFILVYASLFLGILGKICLALGIIGFGIRAGKSVTKNKTSYRDGKYYYGLDQNVRKRILAEEKKNNKSNNNNDSNEDVFNGLYKRR